jgi:hypothetical protein
MAWAPSYTTAEELAAFVRVNDSADARLVLSISAASRTVDQHCGRQFGQVAAPEVRYYRPRWDRAARQWVVDVDDVMTQTGMVVEVDTAGDRTWSAEVDDYVVTPYNAAAKARPWTQIRVLPGAAVQPPAGVEVKVTARWGWTEVPAPVEYATLLQASRLFARKESPYGVAGSPDAGTELRLLAKVDPDVAVALRPFQRVRWVA